VKTTEKTDFAPGGTIHIDNSTGGLTVEGWDQPTVEIEVVRYTWSDHEDKAKEKLNAIQVTKKLDGQNLTITTTHKRFTFAHVDYRIRVPQNSNLVIQHGIGAVIIHDVSGDIDAKAHYGDVMVMLSDTAKYDIEARTKIGDVYSDFDAPMHHLNAYLGERMAVAPAGQGQPHRIHLHVGFGGITIQKMPPNPLLSLN
jgi:hypothetical protein